MLLRVVDARIEQEAVRLFGGNAHRRRAHAPGFETEGELGALPQAEWFRLAGNAMSSRSIAIRASNHEVFPIRRQPEIAGLEGLAVSVLDLRLRPEVLDIARRDMGHTALTVSAFHPEEG